MAAKPHLKKEIALLEQGFRFIAGLDEAGRGAWAGPVIAAAVILPLDRADLSATLTGLNDSKKLTPRQREQLFDTIQQTALAIGVGLASARMVDQINVVEATRQAMEQALAQLPIPATCLLLDHLSLPSIALPQQAFPKADRVSLSVAAASVIAKVTRDRMLVDYNQTYPGYAFDRHKGYGTRLHQTALKHLGACPIHRMSYAPLRALSNVNHR